jgi:hypothetical protein
MSLHIPATCSLTFLSVHVHLLPPQVVSGGAGQPAPQAPPVRRTPLQNALYMVAPPGVTITPTPEPGSQAAAGDGSTPAATPVPPAAVASDASGVPR